MKIFLKFTAVFIVLMCVFMITTAQKDAVPPGKLSDVSVFFEDFNGQLLDTAIWDTTSVVVDAGGSAVVTDSLGQPGILKLSAGQASKGILNGINLQTNSASWRLNSSPSNPESSTISLEYEARFMLKNATQTEFRAGMTIDDEAMTTGQTYGIFFVKHDNSTALRGKEIKANESATDSTASLMTVAKDTWYRLKIVWNGKTARFFVNDVWKGTLSTAANQPIGTKLKPTFEFCSGDSTVQIGYIDYIRVSQKR